MKRIPWVGLSGLVLLGSLIFPAGIVFGVEKPAGGEYLPAEIQVQPPPGSRIISLREAERLALEQNLNLQAQTFDTRASEALIRKGYGIYDPVLELAVSEGENRDLIRAFNAGVQTDIVSGSDSRVWNASLSQKLRYGTNLTLSFDNQRDNIFKGPEGTINPEYRSELSLSLVQPLLKGFGATVTEQEIRFAIKDRDISLQDLKDRAFSILSDVRRAYFEVLRTRDDLVYRESSVRLANKVMDENRARVDVGVLPPVELLEAEVGLKTRERDRLDAERAYYDALDQLSLLLNSAQPVAPTDEALGQPELGLDEDEGVRAALAMRPDMLRNLTELDRIYLEREINRNLILPRLDLAASYSQKGIDDQYGEATEGLSDKDLRSWEVGLNFSYPIGNREAKGELERTEFRLKSKYAQLAQLRDEIHTQVRSAIREVRVAANKIEVATRGAELAKEKLRILLGRKDVGLATTRDVLEGEEDLALARTDEIAAYTDYNNAMTNYLQVSGTLLQYEGVRFSQDLDASGEGNPFRMP